LTQHGPSDYVPYNLSIQSECSVAPDFDPEDGDNMFFQNVGIPDPTKFQFIIVHNRLEVLFFKHEISLKYIQCRYSILMFPDYLSCITDRQLPERLD
jgi:hypothetical protein